MIACAELSEQENQKIFKCKFYIVLFMIQTVVYKLSVIEA